MNKEQRSASSEVHYVSGRDIKELNKELNKEDTSIKKNEHHTYSSQVALQSYISPLTNPSRDEDLSSLERRLDEALERLVLGASTLEEAVERMREARTTMDFSQIITTHTESEIPFNRTAVSSAVSEAIDEGANEASAPSYNRAAITSSPSSDSYPYNVVYTPTQASIKQVPIQEATELIVGTQPPASASSTISSSPTALELSDTPSTANNDSSLESPLHHQRESSLRESLGESHSEELLASSSNEEANLTTAIVEAIEEGFEKVANAQGQDGNQTSSGNSPTSDALPSSGSNIEALARNVMSGNGSAVLGNAVSGGAARLLSSVATAVPAGIAGFTRGGIKGALFAGATATAGREAYAELAEQQAYAEKFGSNFYEMRANTSALREAGALANDAQSDFERIRSAQARMTVGDFSMASQMVSGSRGAIDFSDIERYGSNPARLMAVTTERMIEQGYSEDEIVGTAQLMGFQSLPSLVEGWSEGTREQIEQKITQAQGRDEEAEQAGSKASAIVENTDAVRIAKDAMLDLAARNSDLVEPINGLIESNDSVSKNLDDLNSNLSSFVKSSLSTFDEVKADVQIGVNQAVSSVQETYEHSKDFVSGTYEESRDAVLDTYEKSKDSLSSSFNEGKEWVESNLVSPVESAVESALDALVPPSSSRSKTKDNVPHPSAYPTIVPQSSLSVPTSSYLHVDPSSSSNSSEPLLSALKELTSTIKSSDGKTIVIQNNSDAEVKELLQSGVGIGHSGN